MSVSKKELQSSQDLMTLQQQYNQVVKRNLELRKEIDILSATLQSERMEHGKEVLILRDFVDRAVKFQPPSATAKRKKNGISEGGSI